MSHRMIDEMAALLRCVGSEMFSMELGMVTEVGAVPFGVAIPHCLLDVKKGAEM